MATVSKTLTFDQANSICLKLLPIGGNIWTYASRLRTDGYRAFDAYNDFLESFGTGTEIDLHRICAVEIAKTRMAQPWPMKLTGEERLQLYSSSYLQRMSVQRDLENKCGVTHLTEHYPETEALWRREIDPCHRNKVRFEIQNRSEYAERWSSAESSRQERFEEEAERYASRYGVLEPFEMEDRLAVFKQAMRLELAPLGFDYDEQKSRDEYPIFSKKMTAEWDLCWCLQDVSEFALAPIKPHCSMHLHLRGSRVKGNINDLQSSEYLVFRYQNIIPRFDIAYWTFRTRAELHLAIAAHIRLYGLMAATLESAIVGTPGK